MKVISNLPNGWTNVAFADSVWSVSDEGKRLKESGYCLSGKVAIVDQGEGLVGGYTNQTALTFIGDLPVLVFGDHTRRVKYIDFPFVVGAQGVKILRPASCWNPKFLYYQLQTIEVTNRGYSRHFQYLRKTELRLAPEPEQRRIVAEIEKQLTRIDKGVEALKRTLANLKRYRASVLKAACEGRLVPTEAALAKKEKRDFEPADVLLKRILKERREKWEAEELKKLKAKGLTGGKLKQAFEKQKKKYKEPIPPDTAGLPELPKGWCWASLPQLGELNRGKSKHRPRNDSRLYDGKYPFVQTGDVRRSNGLILEYTQTYNEAGLRQSRLWPKGTLCITIAANIAETGILNFPACFPDSVVGFVCDAYPSLVRMAEIFFRTAKDDIAKYAPATAQKNINMEILSAIAVPLPPVKEQVRIVKEVDRLFSDSDAQERIAQETLLRSGQLRQTVLRDAFAGRLVPQDPKDEPANNLFVRIKEERKRRTEEKFKEKHPVGRDEGRRAMKSTSKRISLYTILSGERKGLAPDALFAVAGFSPDEVDVFYEELRQEERNGRIREVRQNKEKVVLEVVQ